MILTFNKSSSDKKGLNENFDPCQIMVTQRKYLNTEIVNSFIEAEKEHKILIHTSYVTKVFSPNAINYLSKVRKNLSEYILVAKKIKTKYVLIHGPSTLNEYKNFGFGLQLIIEIFQNTDIIPCIEIPSFSKDLIKYIDENFKSNYTFFIKLYFDTVLTILKQLQPQIVIDTAHLHANGLNVDEMIELFDEYKDFYDFIHLNGNKREKFLSDIHVPINHDENKIQNVDKLLKYLSTMNKISVSECGVLNWDYWEKLSEKYKFKLVKYDENYNY